MRLIKIFTSREVVRSLSEKQDLGQYMEKELNNDDKLHLNNCKWPQYIKNCLELIKEDDRDFLAPILENIAKVGFEDGIRVLSTDGAIKMLQDRLLDRDKAIQSLSS